MPVAGPPHPMHITRNCIRQGLLRDRPFDRHRQARRLSARANGGRRARGRRRRSRGGAVSRRLPIDAVQAGAVQLRRGARAAADRARGRYRGEDVPRRLSRAERGFNYGRLPDLLVILS